MGSRMCLADPVVETAEGLEKPRTPRNRVSTRGPELTLGTREQLAWLNALIAHMWPEMEQVMQEMVTQRVEPVLRAKLPEKLQSTHFSKFSLGDHPPIIDLIENYNLAHGTAGVHCTIVYDSDMEVTMSTGKKISFGMKNFSLRGELVFLLRPYIDETSGDGGTGGMTVYFINPPKIGLDFTGLAGVAGVMGIKGLIRGAIDAAMAEKLVLPNSMTQLIGYKDFKVYPMVMGTPTPIGILRVKTLKAKDLPSGDWSLFGIGGGGQDDNYFRFAVGSTAWQARAKTLGEIHEFMIFDPEQLLLIDLWDEDQYSDDDHLGTAGPYHLYEAVRLSGQPIQLTDPSNEKKLAGTVELSIEYFKAKMQKICSSGGIIMIQMRELSLDGRLDSKLVVEATFGKREPQRSPIGKVMKNKNEEIAVDSVLKDMRARLKRHGVKQADINKLTKDEGLTLRQVKTKIALNACMFFSVEQDHLFDGTVELKLWDRKGTKEKKAFRSNNHDKDELLGTATIPLSSLEKTPELMFTDNAFVFRSKNGKEACSAEVTLTFCGLQPGMPPVVNAHGQDTPEPLSPRGFSFNQG